MGMIGSLAWLMGFAATLLAQNTNAGHVGSSSAQGAKGSSPKSAVVKKTTPPNILLLTLDTKRADRMGFLGSKLGLTPNLDALALESNVFTRAYAQAPLTPTSHATILTGTYPQFHRVNDFRVPLDKDLPYGPDILHAHGYRTAAFVASLVLDPSLSAPGFERGFDTYDAGFHHEGPGEDRYHTVERRADEVVAHAIAWLNAHPKRPFFLWVHLYDPHDPYDPPEPYKSRYALAPYDGEIAYMDSAVGKLLQHLKARGLFDDMLIAAMGDHGESLGAHGEDTHGIFLYDETIQVPLLIKLPHEAAPENRIEARVELLDVLPTILKAVDLEVPKDVQGTSLLESMKMPAADAYGAADALHDRPAYAETDYPQTAFHWSALESLRSGKYLFIQAPRRELYDDAADPEAENNLAEDSKAVADTLAKRMKDLRQKTESQRASPETAVDPEAQEKLAALGYIASSGSKRKNPDGRELPDPKDKIEISNLFHRANSLRESGQFTEAAAALEQVLAKQPGPGVYAMLGDTLIDLKEYDKALPVLHRAVELEPDSPMARFRLAKAQMGAGNFADAVPELEFVTARMPGFIEGHVFLETAYARTGRIPETINECKIVLQFLPNHFGSYLILGRFLELQGDLKGALANLKRAESLQPTAPEPHMFLAEVYGRLGRKAEAAREQAAGASAD
jgi:choline-sulfatase